MSVESRADARYLFDLEAEEGSIDEDEGVEITPEDMSFINDVGGEDMSEAGDDEEIDGDDGSDDADIDDAGSL